MGHLQVVAPSCEHSAHLPLGSLSQAEMSLFGWMVPGNSHQPGEGDMGRKIKLFKKVAGYPLRKVSSPNQRSNKRRGKEKES